MKRGFGRADGLFAFTLALCWLFLLLGVLLHSLPLLIVALLFAVLCGLRILFPGERRQKENAVFWRVLRMPRACFRKRRRRGGFVFRHCTGCGVRLRLQPRHGSFTVRCPRCGERFSITFTHENEEETEE